jgi:hypothetical protein
MSKDVLRFYYNEVNGPVGQLFEKDIKDDEFSEGTIGLSTFLTPAGFDEIRMYPQIDIPEPDEDISG